MIWLAYFDANAYTSRARSHARFSVYACAPSFSVSGGARWYQSGKRASAASTTDWREPSKISDRAYVEELPF